MPDFERDLILRQIRQLGDLVAAIVARVRAEADCESGLEAIREAADHGFGPDRSLLDRLDPASAMLLLRDAESAGIYARVCAAEAELLERLGRGETAAGLRARAADVERAARALGREGGG
jgi:hypothetical protein